MKKKLFATVLCLLLLVSMTSAFAVPAGAKEIAGNGYHTRTIKYNTKEYDATLAMNYSSSSGARSIASCKACITVIMSGVTVKYDTINYGYITDTGNNNTSGFTPTKTTVYSNYVPCSKGMGQVIDYMYITGTAIFLGDASIDCHATMIP